MTFTAAIPPASATGIITFRDGVTVLGTATLSGGVATFSTSALVSGSHGVTAAYSGDTSLHREVSTPLNQLFRSIADFAVATSAPNPSVSGQSVTFTATLNKTDPSGTVQIHDGASVLATIALYG